MSYTLWGWGRNVSGQVGDGTNDNKVIPTQIGNPVMYAVTNWSAIAPGDYHTAALKSDGTLWAWGRNDYGQLGDGTYVDQISPIQVGYELVCDHFR
jgi:alpha-tubulin suppressor-like RCC1 family protein